MIKKLLLLIVSFCSIHAMKDNIEWVVKYQQTNIHLTTESLYDICEKVNIAIVGHHEQDLLFQIHPDLVRSTGNFYQRLYIYKTNNIYKKKEHGICIGAVEPCLTTNSYLNEHRQLAKRWQYVSYADELFGGAHAFKEACKDLAFCYKHVLSFTINPKLLQEQFNFTALSKPHPHQKSIALPTLSTKTGFPFEDAAPIAITTIINFIKAHPECYDDIYLSVDDIMQFNTYKKLLLKRTELWDKILLFYMIYKNGNNILSFLPYDVIKLILRLI